MLLDAARDKKPVYKRRGKFTGALASLGFRSGKAIPGV